MFSCVGNVTIFCRMDQFWQFVTVLREKKWGLAIFKYTRAFTNKSIWPSTTDQHIQVWQIFYSLPIRVCSEEQKCSDSAPFKSHERWQCTCDTAKCVQDAPLRPRWHYCVFLELQLQGRTFCPRATFSFSNLHFLIFWFCQTVESTTFCSHGANVFRRSWTETQNSAQQIPMKRPSLFLEKSKA